MSEMKEPGLTAEERAQQFLSGYDWDDWTTEALDTIHDDLTEAFLEAEQRGAEQMREKCAQCFENHPPMCMGTAAEAIRALPTQPDEQASDTPPAQDEAS